MVYIWSTFVAFILLMLLLDLGVFHRAAHAIRVREALFWSGAWIGLALLFAVFVYVGYENHWMGLGAVVDSVDGQINGGRSAVIKYLTGYVIEKSLSVDNLFVIAMIFGALAVPAAAQHRVLFWGVLGALILRGAMIGVGAKLIEHYHWVLYLFGAFLLFTAVKMLFAGEARKDPSDSPLIRAMRRWLPVSNQYDSARFTTRSAGRWALTPLAPALVLVEATDAIFALDSIPAIFAITADPFLIFTSNVFAMLGLRSLFFALAGMMNKFAYLKVSLSLVLAVVGGKMLAGRWLEPLVGPSLSLYLLGLVLLILAGGVVASLIATRQGAVAEPAIVGGIPTFAGPGARGSKSHD